MQRVSPVRAFLLVAAAVSFLGCGFNPRPESGKVACKTGGSNCCPEGYLCVGRGTITPTGISEGTCWNKKDLPPEALAGTHDFTPDILVDKACLVTDWLPPVTGGIDGGVDGGRVDAGATMDGAGGSGDVMAAAGDTPVVPDTVLDAPMEAAAAIPDAAVDLPIADSADVVGDVPTDRPMMPDDGGGDGADADLDTAHDAPTVPDTLDAPTAPDSGRDAPVVTDTGAVDGAIDTSTVDGGAPVLDGSTEETAESTDGGID